MPGGRMSTDVDYVCWFCEANPAVPGLPYVVQLQRRLSSVGHPTTGYHETYETFRVNIPACDDCLEAHSKFRARWIGLGFMLAVVGACVGVFAGDPLTGISVGLWFGAALGSGLGYLCFGRRVLRLNRISEHPDVQRGVAEGFTPIKLGSRVYLDLTADDPAGLSISGPQR
jgi:hypothetical protein